MTHTNRQPGRTGLIDRKIAQEKITRALVNHRKKITHDGMSGLIAAMQHQSIRYSDRGDFTGLYHGPISLR